MFDPRNFLTEHCSFDLVAAAAVSAGTDVDGAYVDMDGYDGVVFFVDIATINAANFLKVQQDEDGSGAGADLEGTALVGATNGNVVAVDVQRPEKRYLRGVIDRGGANTATGPMYAIRYAGRRVPVTHAAEVQVEQHVTPAEGTA
jgi:hypothetical protein